MTFEDGLFWAAITGVPALVGFGVSWGALKAKLYNHVTYGAHADICHKKTQETNVILTEMRKEIKDVGEKVADLNGYLRGIEKGIK